MKNKTYFVKSINGGEVKIEGKTFEEAVQNNKHRLKHIDLQGRDFSKMDFSNAYLHTANLQKCNFIHSKLKQANLREADLTQATLCSADLRGANMFHCNLFTTNLVEADLRGASLDYSCWTLSCRTYNVKVDWNIFKQFVGHLCWLNCDDPRAKRIQKYLKPTAKLWKHWKELPEEKAEK